MAAEHSANADPSALPHFDNPPLAETVLGAQFKPSPELINSVLALYWGGLGSEWQQVQEVSPLELQHERFGDQQGWARLGEVRISVSQELALRLRINNAKNSRMIQVQNGRFHYNWRQTEGETYPKFPAINAEFEKSLRGFESFISGRGIPRLQYDQWEVTYVDIIRQGTVWTEPSDWPRMFSGLPLPKVQSLSPEMFSYGLTFEIEPHLGRLHLKIAHGFLGKPAENVRVIRLELTARGPVSTSLSVSAGLDLGRSCIVRTFDAITSAECHRHWRKRGQ